MKKPLILASLLAVSALAASIFVSAEETTPAVEAVVIEDAATTPETTVSTEGVTPAENVTAAEEVPAEGIIPAAIEESFQSMDANQDGVISITEAENNDVLLDAFSELDLDKTADLTKAEYSKFVALTQF